MTNGRLRLLPILLLGLLLTGCALLETLESDRRSGADNDESRIAAGLREALRVGTERTVERTNQTDGYLGNELIRIALPDQLQSAQSQLRRIGMSRQVDELEVAMNRAAELAAAEAVEVFGGSISRMRPADVYAVFNGGPDAATQYLQADSEETLRERYRPIVASRLETVQGYDLYREIASNWNRIPLVQPLEVDLDRYVTERALDGLFTVLAEEEQRIREDPVARTTAILRDVFGG